jgi:hypothetical protein
MTTKKDDVANSTTERPAEVVKRLDRIEDTLADVQQLLDLQLEATAQLKRRLLEPAEDIA